MQQTFRVKAVWDAQAEVFYSESDIEGLHIEAATLDEFEAILLDVAPELIMVNHRSASYTLRSSFDFAPLRSGRTEGGSERKAHHA